MPARSASACAAWSGCSACIGRRFRAGSNIRCFTFRCWSRPCCRLRGRCRVRKLYPFSWVLDQERISSGKIPLLISKIGHRSSCFGIHFTNSLRSCSTSCLSFRSPSIRKTLKSCFCDNSRPLSVVARSADRPPALRKASIRHPRHPRRPSQTVWAAGSRAIEQLPASLSTRHPVALAPRFGSQEVDICLSQKPGRTSENHC